MKYLSLLTLNLQVLFPINLLREMTLRNHPIILLPRNEKKKKSRKSLKPKNPAVIVLMTESGSGIALHLTPLLAPRGSEAVAFPALCAANALPALPSPAWRELVEEHREQPPLHCTAASPQSSEEATRQPWVAHGTRRAPVQLCTPRSGGPGPTEHVCTCTCLSLWEVVEPLGLELPGAHAVLLPTPVWAAATPTAARTRSSTAGSPIHAHPPAPGGPHPPEAWHGAHEADG